MSADEHRVGSPVKRVILQISPSGLVKWASRSVQDLLGVPPEELLGKPFKEVLPKATASPQSVPSEDPLQWVTMGRFEIPGGGIGEMRQMLLVGGDSLIELRPPLIFGSTEFEQFVANVLADSADAILCLDLDNRITIWNRGAEALYGYRAEEILGKSVELLVPEEHREELHMLERRVREEGQVLNYPAVRRHRDGREINVTITRTALRDAEGRLVGTSVIIRDVTETVQKNRQLQHSEKMAAVGQLAAGIAHELGTPLNVISGTAEFLEGEAAGNPEFTEGLRTIRRQAQVCTRLLRDLMDYARRPTFEKAEVDLNACIRDTLRLVRRLFERDKIVTETALAENLAAIDGDANQLEQVFVNIFINAWQAMPGGGRLRVVTRPASGGEEVVVEIHDTGTGIAPEHLPHIFNPFFTTKEAGGGTGLGLAVCDQIVTAHGGSITASSQPGHGAVFTLRFPAAARGRRVAEIPLESHG